MDDGLNLEKKKSFSGNYFTLSVSNVGLTQIYNHPCFLFYRKSTKKGCVVVKHIHTYIYKYIYKIMQIWNVLFSFIFYPFRGFLLFYNSITIFIVKLFCNTLLLNILLIIYTHRQADARGKQLSFLRCM